MKFKPEIVTDSYVTQVPIIFKEHSITVRKHIHNVTRVAFKNVPLNVPDEEIIYLCWSYGVPLDNKVHWEVLTNRKNKGMVGSTRYVDMQLKKGAAFENYYWLEGPLPGDQGRGILVLHNGQPSQCSNCLRRASTGCPGGGNGKICELKKTPRAKMLSYMQSLKVKLGYESLKSKYLEKQAKNFPSLHGPNVEERATMEENTETDEPILPSNPIEEI